MAKMMKKWMAFVLALSLMAHVIPLPVTAEENGAPDVQSVTVDLTNADGQKIGEKTTTTTTDTQDSSTSYQHNVKEESNWNSQDGTSTTADPVQTGNVTTEVSGSVTTDVTGEEISHDNQTSDKTTGIQVLYGDTVGNETTTVTDTTVTVTTTTDVVISQETDGPTKIVSGETKNDRWTPIEQTSEGTWVENGFTEGNYTATGAVTTTNNGKTAIDVDVDPLDSQDAALTMTQKDTTDSVKLNISLEDALANDITYTDGQVLADGSVVTFNKDVNGNLLGYTIHKTTPTGSTTGEITTDAVGGMAPKGREVVTYTKPEGYTEGTENVVDSQGNVIGTITTEAITDESGNVIGYTITQVTNGPSGNLPGVSTENLPTPAATWTLPQKPVPNAPVTSKGLTTTQTVEEIYENGVLVGYETITRTTDEDGNEQSRESVKLYGTKTTLTSTLEKTPASDNVTTTTVTTVLGTHTTQNYTRTSVGTSTTVTTRVLTDEIYELVDTDEGMFLLLEGKVYKVKAMDDHGEAQMKTLQPDLDLAPSKDGAISTSTDLRGAQDFKVTTPQNDAYDAQYVGYGLESRIRVREGDGSNTLAHQFALKDSAGNMHYVYCVDLNTTAIKGTNYNMVNVKDSGYFTESVAQKVEAIALTGFWGTTSGTGSLDNLKAYMKANKDLHNLTDAEIDSITEGMALSGTQAALWRYGHSDTANPMGSNVAGPVYNSSSNTSSTQSPDSEEKKLVNAVYQALININLNKVNNRTTELLNTENFATETSLVIKEKAKDSNGTVKTRTDSNGVSHDVYVTDVVFTVNVKESDFTGNMVVTLTDELGNTLATKQVATENSNFLGKILGDDSLAFTIEDVELAEGIKVNLNLTGTQNLEEGAYLYTAAVYTNSQTFIGVASGNQKVNLNVQMKFDVTDPKAAIQHTTKTQSQKKTDVTHYIKTDEFSRERTGTVTDAVQTVITEVTGTLVQTDIQTATTKTQRDWSDSYRYELVPINDGGGTPTEPEDEIPEEEVPLASAPKTGDMSLTWLFMALICLAGAAMLSRKKSVR